MLEAAEQRIGRFAGPAAERELRLALGDPHEADQLELVVVVEGPAQELEFPVRPAAHIQHAIRPAAAIDHDQPLVVGRRCVVSRLRIGRSIGRRHAYLVKTHAVALGPELKSAPTAGSSSPAIPPVCDCDLLAFLVDQLGDDDWPAKPLLAMSARTVTGADSKLVWLTETPATDTSGGASSSPTTTG